ncbi:MAG TPA: Type 1 glutamine amidotransferase-like domain-containing protein [Candidatus Limnocylindrales bacterium]
MTGPLGLHGGGEFMPGDERFLGALLEAAGVVATRRAAAVRVRAASSGRASQPAAERISVVIVPTASARAGPQQKFAEGREAIARVAARLGVEVDITEASIVDREGGSAVDFVAMLRDADLVHLPGGEPDLIPALLSGTPAAAAIDAAHRGGAVVAGASAGAMGMGVRTWTPAGWLAGLGLVRGLIVVPHFALFDGRGWETTVESLRADGIGYLGLDERTGVLSENGNGRSTWRVSGEGRAMWFPAAGDPVTATDGETLDLDA